MLLSAHPLLNRSQLTAESSTRAGATFSYGYDGGTTGGPGNPTSFKGTANTFNADNQVTNTGYAYDGNGSPTTYRSTALTFDPEQRMTAYGTAETNGYDGDGLRAWVAPSGGSKSYFVYDGDTRLLFLKSDGSIGYYLTFGANGLLGVHNTAVSTDDRYFTFDLSGATVMRLAPDQSVQYTVGAQSSFGYCMTADSLGGTGAQWGYFSDGLTGLLLCTHRFYDPSNGRWLTRDPIGYGGGINLYGYVSSDPGNRNDPSGLDFALPGGGSIPIGLGGLGLGGLGLGGLGEFGAGAAAAGAAALPVLLGAGAAAAGWLIGAPIGNAIANGIPGQDGLPAPTEVRGGKGLRPDPNATGDHCTWRTGESGNIDHGAAWERNTNPQQPAPWNPGGRYDRVGPAHTNRDGTVVPPPHTQDPTGEATPYP